MRGLMKRWPIWQPHRFSQRRTLLTTSYTCGPGEPALFEETIGQHFARIVSKYGDQNAVISKAQGRRSTYAELDRDSNVFARGLQSLGVKKGDRVCVSLGNNMEFATLTYACFKLGAILVPLNPAFTTQQVASALTHLEASHLIIGAETNLPFKAPRSNISMLEAIVPNIGGSRVESELVPSLENIVLYDNSKGRVDTAALRASTPFEALCHDTNTSTPSPSSILSPTDIVNIQFTSGTTSTPKAACLSHRSILNNGAQIGDRMLLTPDDIVCCPPPLFHCFGCILGYMATATHGSAIVFPTEAFNPFETLKAVQEERCTALYGVPTMFLAELELINNGTVPYEGFQHLRTGIAAGSSIPAELMRKLHKVLNLTELTICYGMTETSPVSCMTTTDDPLDKRINSVGRLLPHVSAKVVDPKDHSHILPVGEKGELAVSGYLVMEKYWDAPGKTAEVMKIDEQGQVWMHTGDEACMDADGYISITGRIKDLIIRGGENIHPLEVENCLLANPRIKEASVVGLPDEKYGEVVAAFIIRREEDVAASSVKASIAKNNNENKNENNKTDVLDIEDVRDWVRNKLSHHLVPKYVFFVNEYTKTASGKIQKFVLRELGLELIRESKSKSKSKSKR